MFHNPAFYLFHWKDADHILFLFLTKQNVCTQKVSIKVNNLSLVSSLFFLRFHKSFTNVLCSRKTDVLQTEFDIQNKIWRRQTSKN